MSELPDRIAEVFKGRTVFISGATGFLGKALVEMLLRLFKTLIEQNPNAIKKCVSVYGDVSELNLGLSETDRGTLTDEIDFIFHSAATTRFDEPLKHAIYLYLPIKKSDIQVIFQMLYLRAQRNTFENELGTYQDAVLVTVTKMLFVHVSTSYAFPKENVILERTYDPPANPHEVLNNINSLSDDAMSDFRKNGCLPRPGGEPASNLQKKLFPVIRAPFQDGVPTYKGLWDSLLVQEKVLLDQCIWTASRMQSLYQWIVQLL
ncbi:hypothetical protein NQ314_000355 [Rhamnusium bicolor]|uniref:Fatty acyl-CoA reductase n=1 Tax=Rhamnusium bicolor TaxID=1586634 RepID=A0AAV8ZYH6_9CUCU|nr:hypothetical protein NQ314_000355 [Rhamnusium bicolor]